MPDIRNSGCMILWGYNPSYTRITHATAVVEALKRGMRLIVIDPRHVGLANKANLWLRVRPGTDGALALGIANVMIECGWYDRDFIRDWSNGPLLVRADTGRLLTGRDLGVDSAPHRIEHSLRILHRVRVILVAVDRAPLADAPLQRSPCGGRWAPRHVHRDIAQERLAGERA